MTSNKTAFIVMMMVLPVFTASVWADTYSGGTGESNNPYRIDTVADWQ